MGMLTYTHTYKPTIAFGVVVVYGLKTQVTGQVLLVSYVFLDGRPILCCSVPCCCAAIIVEVC